jgi:hypothetical protein
MKPKVLVNTNKGLKYVRRITRALKTERRKHQYATLQDIALDPPVCDIAIEGALDLLNISPSTTIADDAEEVYALEQALIDRAIRNIKFCDRRRKQTT